MGIKLSNAPVCLTIAQVKFNTILDIDKKISDIQNDLSAIGFPVYSSVVTHQIGISQDSDGSVQQQQLIMHRHVFKNLQNSAALLLDRDALTYELSDYPEFEGFTGKFLEALQVISKHLPIVQTQRLGMRMVDAVYPLLADNIASYLVAEALGISSQLGVDLDHQQTFSEAVFRKGSRSLIFRSVKVNQGVALPPDISPTQVKLSDRFMLYKGETIMLDSDSFDEEHVDFDTTQIISKLRSLKANLSFCFKSVVTAHALEVWR